MKNQKNKNHSRQKRLHKKFLRKHRNKNHGKKKAVHPKHK